MTVRPCLPKRCSFGSRPHPLLFVRSAKRERPQLQPNRPYTPLMHPNEKLIHVHATLLLRSALWALVCPPPPPCPLCCAPPCARRTCTQACAYCPPPPQKQQPPASGTFGPQQSASDCGGSSATRRRLTVNRRRLSTNRRRWSISRRIPPRVLSGRTQWEGSTKATSPSSRAAVPSLGPHRADASIQCVPTSRFNGVPYDSSIGSVAGGGGGGRRRRWRQRDVGHALGRRH